MQWKYVFVALRKPMSRPFWRLHFCLVEIKKKWIFAVSYPSRRIISSLHGVGDEPVGFVTGIELTHPDKGTEMFLYELGVDKRAQRKGVGRSLVESLIALASERNCYGMWVLTDADNEGAQRTYVRAGGQIKSVQQMFEWKIAISPLNDGESGV